MNYEDRLTPFDAELFLMVESLTGQEREILAEYDGYYMTVRLKPEMEDKKKDAIRDAIVGRIGEKLIWERWTDENVGTFQIRYGDPVGKITDSARFDDGDISDSNIFYIPETSLRGLSVLKLNFERLVRFVGNGQWETKPDGQGIFHFLNASGTVYCDAPEGTYLVFVRKGLYRVATKEEMKKFAMM